MGYVVGEHGWFHSSPLTGVAGQPSVTMLRVMTPKATLKVLSYMPEAVLKFANICFLAAAAPP